MNSSKGLGVGVVLKLTLALMTASLFISVSTVGEIGTAVEEAMENIQNQTDYTVEVDNIETLSNASLFVRQRAGNDGCAETSAGAGDFLSVQQQNENGGYPALADEYMGRYPNCLGTSSTLARGAGATSGLEGAQESAQGQFYEEGQDMEGIYSRVRFEVTETVVIETSETSGDTTWLEDRIVGVSNQGFLENTMSPQECLDISTAGEIAETVNENQDNIDDTFTGEDGNDGSGVQNEDTSDVPGFGRFLGMGDHFVVYFQPEEASSEPYRSDKWMQEFAQYLNNRAYCHPEGDLYNYGDITIAEFDQHPVISATRRLENKIVLCPGDRGYIQMNKRMPKNQGEAGEAFLSGSGGNMPYIQITNLGTSDDSTCASAEMAPAAEFYEVKTAKRIELPLEAGDQIAAMIPDEFENTYEDLIEDYWDDSIADETVEDINDEFSGVASTIENGVNNLVDGTVDIVGGALGALGDALGLEEEPEDLAEYLDEQGIDPMEDMINNVHEAVTEAIDYTWKDSLHLELTFTNQHLDMDDDAYPADFRGGFQITLFESEEDNQIDGQFETEPAGGLYWEDVPQGDRGAGELDALQSGWDGNGGIADMECYVKAELALEQKVNNDQFSYPERSEQVWDIWIGDLGDDNSDTKYDGDGNACSRDQRIDGQDGGIAWGGTSTLEGVEISTNEYFAGDQKLEVTVTATSNGDGNLDGGRLEVGNSTGLGFELAGIEESCEGGSCELTANFSDVSLSDTVNIEARFTRNDDRQTETETTTPASLSPSEDFLGTELWNWDTEYSSDSGLFNATVTYGNDDTEDRQNIEDATLQVTNTSSGGQIDSTGCTNGYTTECSLEMEDLSPNGESLELNATINKYGAEFWDTETMTVS